jgi:ABC-type lipoprotein release transport system permease subunit
MIPRQNPTGPSAALVRLAWRNIWRHRRRTLLLTVVVAYAVFGTIFFWGLNDGIIDSVLTTQARYIAAPVLVTTATYRDDPDPEHALPDLAVVSLLQRAPGVRAAAPRLEFPALLRSPYAAQAVLARGVVPAEEGVVSAIPAHIVEGRMLRAPGELVLGRRLAGRLDVRVGERAVLDTASLAGPAAAGLVVVGLADTGVPVVDEGAALVHLDDARRLTGVATATGIALDVPRGQEDATARAIQPLLPEGLRVFGLSEILGAIETGLQVRRASSLPVALIFALVAAAAVTSTAVVSVIERTREFGMIAALGLTPGRLARVVVLEVVYTTGIGWAIGLAAGYAAVALLARANVLGVVIGSYSEAFAGFPLGREIYTAVHPAYALYASMTVVVAVLLALMIPARRIRRLQPAQAMRVE